ncbi:helix-turn-helix domain-containing protein [Kitasatospora sp. NPDC058170]|uniref:helix-turn-helix domain-containing protein n=1 Tax=Kitasatospora sp. NPDC058170 TaxID=3346364 RepID=UPI0036DBF551
MADGGGEPGAGSFAVRTGYAVYRGPSAAGSLHAHAAFQIALAPRGEVAMADAAGTRHSAPVLVVPPMVRHRMLATTPDLLTYFVEPHCAFADRLRVHRGHGISAADDLHGLAEEDLRPAGARPSEELDPRLLAAMDALAAGRIPMPALAASVGLSPQRLRALAHGQLGMPLTRWRIWQGLSRAARALQEGRSITDAAATAGFADQAHFNRRLREMIGLTPAAILPLLAHGADAPGDARGSGKDWPVHGGR